MTDLNMTKAYRQEISQLRKRSRELGRDADRIEREARREITKIIRESEKALSGIKKQSEAIERRRLVLAGRIAK